ncbi:baseplate hub protein, partial [Clostridium beijerinckii]|nr:baseplate hub protein [Clostridium beijerinckii]
DDNPIAVAQVSLTNFNGNLTSSDVGESISSAGFDDGDWIRKFMFDATGTIFDEKITDKMIALKNNLYDQINLGEGTRVHIRLGYGSNPSRYPVCFNGTISEIDADEVITFVAESDGCELMNEPLTDKTEATNKDLKLGVEVSNIMATLLVARQSDFEFTFKPEFFKYKSKYGIENFGLHIHDGDEFSLSSALISLGELIAFPAATLTNIVDENMYYRQYDIVKNIYKGTYEGIPFCKDPYNPADGEFNFRFFCSGKTPWDVMKMCEKAVPEFVAYPRYFGFETRMFYGLPIWLCKYDYAANSDGIYERAKSFAQVHEITTLDSIANNSIKLNSKNHNTNYIGIYSLGGDLSSTPAIMSDRNIDWSKQSTKVVDTTSVQDFSWVPGIITKLLSWTGMYDNGKQLAINTCVSELMNSWKNTYDGNIVVLGQPQIRAYDYIYMNDIYTNMSG